MTLTIPENTNLRIKNRCEPDKYMQIILENAIYRIRIRYLQTNYTRRKEENSIYPEDILIQCITKQPEKAPNIQILLKTDTQEQNIGIEPNIECTFIPEKDIKEYAENILYASEIIDAAKYHLTKYFGENILK